MENKICPECKYSLMGDSGTHWSGICINPKSSYFLQGSRAFFEVERIRRSCACFCKGKCIMRERDLQRFTDEFIERNIGSFKRFLMTQKSNGIPLFEELYIKERYIQH